MFKKELFRSLLSDGDPNFFQKNSAEGDSVPLMVTVLYNASRSGWAAWLAWVKTPGRVLWKVTPLAWRANQPYGSRFARFIGTFCYEIKVGIIIQLLTKLCALYVVGTRFFNYLIVYDSRYYNCLNSLYGHNLLCCFYQSKIHRGCWFLLIWIFFHQLVWV